MITLLYVAAFKPEAQAGRKHEEAGQEEVNTNDLSLAWIQKHLLSSFLKNLW